MVIVPQSNLEFKVGENNIIYARLNELGYDAIRKYLGDKDFRIYDYYKRQIIFNFSDKSYIKVPRIIVFLDENKSQTHIILPEFLLKFKRHILKDFLRVLTSEASCQVANMIYDDEGWIDCDLKALSTNQEEDALKSNTAPSPQCSNADSDVSDCKDKELDNADGEKAKETFPINLLNYFERHLDSYRNAIAFSLEMIKALYPHPRTILSMRIAKGFNLVKDWFFCVNWHPIEFMHLFAEEY